MRAFRGLPFDYVECKIIDVLDVLERAFELGNLIVSAEIGTANVYNLVAEQFPVLNFGAESLQRRHGVKLVELMRIMCASVRTYHTYLRAAMRVSLACWLSPEIKRIVGAVRDLCLDRVVSLREEKCRLEQEIAEDAELTCDVYEQRRLSDEAARQRAKTSVETNGAYQWRGRGDLKFTWEVLDKVEQEMDHLRISICSNCENTSIQRFCCQSKLSLHELLDPKTASGLWRCLEKIWFMTERELAGERVRYLDIVEPILCEYEVDARGVQNGKHDWYSAERFPEILEQCKQRFDMIRSYFDYVRARHAHVRAAVRLPSHLLSSAGLTPEMLETRHRIRAERRLVAVNNRLKAAKMEADLPIDLTPHVMAMVLGRCKGWEPESIFERMYLPDDAYRLIVKMLVNEGECGEDGNCNAGIDQLVSLKPQLPEEEPPDAAQPCKRLCTGT
jgi:hypothetical protein